MNVLKRTGKSNGTEINKRLGLALLHVKFCSVEYCSILKCCCAWLLIRCRFLVVATFDGLNSCWHGDEGRSEPDAVGGVDLTSYTATR